ncbi:uncharacterized protein LOC143280398 [Babylonia areolata]|uniref:uncharacterized protein LOC143280398 n=1 Tax=Babylonia areolata TaxID=304850 RepID=UPI003FD11E90
MALLQGQHQQQNSQHKNEDGSSNRRPSVAIKATSTTTTAGEGAGGGGAGEGGRAVRRASSMLGLTGPKTASLASHAPAASTSSSSSTTNVPPPPGATFFGVLASKRLARRFASRFHRRRLGTMSSLLSSGGGPPPVHMEPTYRLEPRRKFRPSEVEKMLEKVVGERMNKFHYSARLCANMCKALGDDIKEAVKGMNFDRYKIVSNVVIGQKKDQAVLMCSRCAWDEKLDNFASYTFQNEHVFCTATVFGIYME